MVREFAKPQTAREIEARGRARALGVRVAVIAEARRYCAVSQSEAGATHTTARTPVGWACSCQGYYHTGCCKHLGAVQRRAAREGWTFGADEAVARCQWCALPPAGVQVQDAAGLLGEARVAGIEPMLVLPGLERIGSEDAPDGARAHRRGVGVGRDQPRQVGDAVTTERLVTLRRQLTGQRLDHGDVPRGGKWVSARALVGRSGQSRPSPSVSARCRGLSSNGTENRNRRRYPSRASAVVGSRKARRVPRVNCRLSLSRQRNCRLKYGSHHPLRGHFCR